MRTSSVANETVKHYGVTINKAEGLRTGQLIILLREMFSFVCYKPDTCKYKPAYKKIWIFPQEISVNMRIKYIGMLSDISREELILICLGLTNTLGH